MKSAYRLMMNLMSLGVMMGLGAALLFCVLGEDTNAANALVGGLFCALLGVRFAHKLQQCDEGRAY